MIISESINNINYIQYVSNILDANNEPIVHLLFKSKFVLKQGLLIKYKNNEWQKLTIEESFVICHIDLIEVIHA